MDFHACFEACLGGDWYLFDPTDDITPRCVAIISRGRDASSAALSAMFGRIVTAPVRVPSVVAPELQPATA